MTITDVCKETGATKDALKYYEREGLLSPKRGENKYRIYDEHDVIRIQQILCFRQLNMGMKDIKEYFCLDTKHKKLAVKEQLDILKEQRKHIDNMISTLEYMQFFNAKYIPLCDQINVDVVGPFIKDLLRSIKSNAINERFNNLDDDYVDQIDKYSDKIASLGIVDASDNELQKIICELENYISEKTQCGIVALLGIMTYEDNFLTYKNSDVKRLIEKVDYKTIKQGIEYYLGHLVEPLLMPIIESSYAQYSDGNKIALSNEDYETIVNFWNERINLIPVNTAMDFVKKMIEIISVDDEIKNDKDIVELFEIIIGIFDSFKEMARRN